MGQVGFGNLVCVHGETVVEPGQQEVLLLEHDVQLLPKDRRIEQVLHAKTDPRDLVGVRRPDPALRGPEPVLPEVSLGDLVDLQVIGHHQVGVARDLQARGVDASPLQGVHLLEQHAGIEYHAVGDDGRHVPIEDA